MDGLIFRLQSVVSKYRVQRVILGRVFPAKDGGSFKELPPWRFLLSNVWVSGCSPRVPVLPAESPPPSLLLFALFLHLKTAMTWSVDEEVIGSISWEFWQYGVFLCLSWQVHVCLSEAEWKWMMLNLHKSSKIWYWFFLYYFPFLIFLGGGSYSRFQRKTSHFSCFFCTCFWGCSFCCCWIIFTQNLVFWNDFLYST